MTWTASARLRCSTPSGAGSQSFSNNTFFQPLSGGAASPRPPEDRWVSEIIFSTELAKFKQEVDENESITLSKYIIFLLDFMGLKYHFEKHFIAFKSQFRICRFD